MCWILGFEGIKIKPWIYYELDFFLDTLASPLEGERFWSKRKNKSQAKRSSEPHVQLYKLPDLYLNRVFRRPAIPQIVLVLTLKRWNFEGLHWYFNCYRVPTDWKKRAVSDIRLRYHRWRKDSNFSNRRKGGPTWTQFRMPRWWNNRKVSRAVLPCHTMHSNFNGHTIPTENNLQANKTVLIYNRVFSALIDLNPYLVPQQILGNFDLAAINAFK